MNVALLWFKCKNNDCGYVPDMTRKQIRRLMKDGLSASSQSRQRLFLRRMEGYYFSVGDNLYFHCKHGDILIQSESTSIFNSTFYPIHDREECNQCLTRQKNERLLQL